VCEAAQGLRSLDYPAAVVDVVVVVVAVDADVELMSLKSGIVVVEMAVNIFNIRLIRTRYSINGMAQYKTLERERKTDGRITRGGGGRGEVERLSYSSNIILGSIHKAQKSVKLLKNNTSTN